MSPVLKEVTSERDLDRFVRFPDELYKGCAQYVPPLHRDQKFMLTGAATLKYCRHRMWLAEQDGKVVGRISAIINPRYNEFYGVRRVRFGWFDTIDSKEVAAALLGEAEKWAKGEGMTEIHGPLHHMPYGRQGVLVEGFENVPPFNCIYNYPYYRLLLEELGFEPERDSVQYIMVANHGVPDKARRVAALVEEKYGLHVGCIDKLKKDPAMVEAFFDTFDSSFRDKVPNYVPLTEEEKAQECRRIIPFLTDRTSCLLLDRDDNIVGFGVSMPSMSQALQKAKGRLLPFGWFHLWRALHKYELTDLMANGVCRQWQNKGVSSIYYREMAEKALRAGNRRAISSPQTVAGTAANIWNCYEHEPYMLRRTYIKKID